MLQFSQQINTYQNLIRLTEVRQRVISHNIANVNTPEFKAMDIDFSSQSVGSIGSHETGQPADLNLVERTGLGSRSDGNNVDIDVEVAEANKNALLHQTYMLLLSGQFNNFRRAIQT